MRKHPPIVEKAYSIIESKISRATIDNQDICVYNYDFEIYMFPYVEPKAWRYKDWPKTYSFFRSKFSEQAGEIFDSIIKEISKDFS